MSGLVEPQARARRPTPPDTATRRHEVAVGVVVFCVVASVAFAFVYPRQWTRGLLINDEMWHAHLTRNVFNGHGFVTDTLYPIQTPSVETFPAHEVFKQPGYSMVAAAVWSVTAQSHYALVGISIMAFSLACVLLYWLARRLGWGRSPALAVVALTAFSDRVLAISTAALPESVYFLLFLAALHAVIAPSTARAVVCGVVHGALVLVKGHAVIYIPVLAAYLLLSGGNARRTRLLAYVLALWIALAVPAALLLDGTTNLGDSTSTYSQALLIGTEQARSEGLGYFHIDPPDPIQYVLTQPGDYLVKYLRMVSRSGAVLTVLGGPVAGPLLLPALLLAVSALAIGLIRRADRLSEESTQTLLLMALVVTSFGGFWAIDIKERYLLHVYPLMLLLILRASVTLQPWRPTLSPTARRLGGAFLLLVTVAYPVGYALRHAYTDPFFNIGRNLAVRYVDYEELVETVASELDHDALVVSDMAHEINWLHGNRTMRFPSTPQALRSLVSKYEVDALYEHPRFPRDWEWIATEFRLVDTRNGRLWVRRQPWVTRHESVVGASRPRL